MPKFAIIISEQDPAAMNIKLKLLQLFKFSNVSIFRNRPVYQLDDTSLYSIDSLHITTDNLDKEIDADYFIFPSKHKAKSENKTFCVHAIGNFGKAEAGGEENKLVPAMPSHMKSALNKLKELNDINFEVSMEATHHGPYLEKPTMFIEIGSTENEWKNNSAAEIVARVIMSTIEDGWEHDAAIVIGGTHYNHEANRLMSDSGYAAGHICPKHALEFLDEFMLAQMLHKSGAKLAVLDWKGLGQYKDKITKMCETLKIEVKKSKEITDSS